ncbi:hypothetical protein RKE38_18235 [Phycicoccus sp. M110.8]|uniref:hypothetical protein n=1 Tax=Phycicoccus sp. M110.8 TaxID=3075433 RepID=UPI0028FD92A3|nr:hypothetical protein [Phycicoccus sp. M110.8]MDU0315643.1 hypothetical protein [Phycicoccus sp. M110.8]
MAQAELDQLLERMPAIAEAVEKFTSEAIQSQVLEALIGAFKVGARSGDGEVGDDGFESGDSHESQADTGTTTERAAAVPAANGTGTSAPKRTARKSGGSRAKQSFSLDKDLDMVRGGSKSLKDFVGEKQPKTVLDKVLISVYWLTRILEGDQPATLDRVYTCFKHMEWPIPSDLANTAQQAGVKGWLDSRKRDDIKVVIGGENRVEHELPAEPKK